MRFGAGSGPQQYARSATSYQQTSWVARKCERSDVQTAKRRRDRAASTADSNTREGTLECGFVVSFVVLVAFALAPRVITKT